MSERKRRYAEPRTALRGGTVNLICGEAAATEIEIWRGARARSAARSRIPESDRAEPAVRASHRPLAPRTQQASMQTLLRTLSALAHARHARSRAPCGRQPRAMNGCATADGRAEGKRPLDERHGEGQERVEAARRRHVSASLLRAPPSSVSSCVGSKQRRQRPGRLEARAMAACRPARRPPIERATA